MKKKLFITLAGVMVTVITALLLLVYSYTSAPGSGKRTTDFHVRPGYGSITVGSLLYKEKLIKSRTAFRLYLRLTGKASSLKTGVYSLNNGMSVQEITEILTSGVSKMISLTIPEGYNNRQIAKRFAELGLVKSEKEFHTLAGSKALLKKFNIPGKSVEGYLFPDTYTFPVNYSAKKLLEQMLKNFQTKTSTLPGFPTDRVQRHRLVILASIVEREAKRKEERAVIAGVFANRLKKNLPLESCATIQYLFDKPKIRLYYIHLEKKSPYNTYKHKGLPPGPIANPGLPSIEATLNPEKTDYLFFVVKDDHGRHQFSKTFGEHNRAKKKYILR
jgi:UPF0755 protein